MRGGTYNDVSQIVAINIGCCQGDRHRSSLLDSDLLRFCNRKIIDRVHNYCNSGCVSGLAIGHNICERVCTMIVRGRGIGSRTWSGHCDVSMGRSICNCGGQIIAIRSKVIEKNVDHSRSVLVSVCRIVICCWWAIARSAAIGRSS